MNIKNINQFSHRELTYEDLKGMTAEGYIRDSTEDQRDGFGPELQKKAIENFAKTYGLFLGAAWYTDFITGTSTLKRSGFLEALLDIYGTCILDSFYFHPIAKAYGISRLITY